MLHDTRLVKALMEGYTAGAAATGTRGRASPLRLSLARWLVKAGTRLQGEHVAVESKVVAFDPCLEVAPDLPQAA